MAEREQNLIKADKALLKEAKKSILESIGQEKLTKEQIEKLEVFIDLGVTIATAVKGKALEILKSRKEAIEELNRILYTRFKIGERNQEGKFTSSWAIEKIAQNLEQNRYPVNRQVSYFKTLGANLENLYQETTKEMIPFEAVRLGARCFLLGTLIDTYFIGSDQSPPAAQPPLF